MVKLVRMTTENNNKFNTNIDSDIVVGEKAQLAVKNLTFESLFKVLSVGANENTVSFNFNSTQFALTRTGNLQDKSYDSSNYPDFFTDMSGACNDCCFVNLDPANANAEPFANYMQFSVVNKDDKRILSQRNTPMLHPLLKTRAFNLFYDPAQPVSGYEPSKIFFNAKPALYDTFGSIESPADTTPGVWVRNLAPSPPVGANDPLLYGLVTRESGTSGSVLNRFITPNDGVEWSKGSAVWWCRIHELTGVAGNKDEHGFAIGLSYTKISVNATEIPSAARDFEVRCHDSNHNIFYIDPTTSNTLIDGGVGTNDVGAGNEANHDIMMIRKDGNNIRAYYITSVAGGTRTKLFDYVIPVADREKQLYPYLYVCGSLEQAKMGQPSITLDPFAIDKLDGSADAYKSALTPQAGDLYGYDFDGAIPDYELDSGYNRSSAAMQTVLPSIDQEYYQTGGKAGQVTQITINKEILRFMGFEDPKYRGSGNFTFTPEWNRGTNAGTVGFALNPNGLFQISNSDNYVVVIDSLPVLSYDCSLTQGALVNNTTVAKTGRRLNILATIPINDNGGIVQFDANEAIYIDLDNSFKQNISNLRLRVLDKNLQEVQTVGMSVLTLLLKDGDK